MYQSDKGVLCLNSPPWSGAKWEDVAPRLKTSSRSRGSTPPFGILRRFGSRQLVWPARRSPRTAWCAGMPACIPKKSWPASRHKPNLMQHNYSFSSRRQVIGCSNMKHGIIPCDWKKRKMASVGSYGLTYSEAAAPFCFWRRLPLLAVLDELSFWGLVRPVRMHTCVLSKEKNHLCNISRASWRSTHGLWHTQLSTCLKVHRLILIRTLELGP